MKTLYRSIINKNAINSQKRTTAYFYRELILCSLAIFISTLFLSCSSTKYIPIEKTKTVYQNRIDTIKQIDSIFNEKTTIIREADSSLVQQLGLKLKTNEKAILVLKKELEKQTHNKLESIHDTVLVKDSIPIPYPIEKQLTKWQQFKLDFSDVVFSVFLLIIIICIVYIFINRKK